MSPLFSLKVSIDDKRSSGLPPCIHIYHHLNASTHVLSHLIQLADFVASSKLLIRILSYGTLFLPFPLPLPLAKSTNLRSETTLSIHQSYMALNRSISWSQSNFFLVLVSSTLARFPSPPAKSLSIPTGSPCTPHQPHAQRHTVSPEKMHPSPQDYSPPAPRAWTFHVRV